MQRSRQPDRNVPGPRRVNENSAGIRSDTKLLKPFEQRMNHVLDVLALVHGQRLRPDLLKARLNQCFTCTGLCFLQIQEPDVRLVENTGEPSKYFCFVCGKGL